MKLIVQSIDGYPMTRVAIYTIYIYRDLNINKRKQHQKEINNDHTITNLTQD